jgi:hypothetical protein
VSLVSQLTITTTIGGCPIVDDGRSLIADRGSPVCPSPMAGSTFTSDGRDVIGYTRKIIDDSAVDGRACCPRYPRQSDTRRRQTTIKIVRTIASPWSQSSKVIFEMLRQSWQQSTARFSCRSAYRRVWRRIYGLEPDV